MLCKRCDFSRKSSATILINAIINYADQLVCFVFGHSHFLLLNYTYVDSVDDADDEQRGHRVA